MNRGDGGEKQMVTLILRLNPRLLENPDADIRYRLPDLLAERSRGVISDDGYDYVGEEPLLVLFLKTSDLTLGLGCVLDVIENVRVLDNDLRPGIAVTVERDGKWEVVYPPGFTGPFLPE
jgi:hypothetical protein